MSNYIVEMQSDKIPTRGRVLLKVALYAETVDEAKVTANNYWRKFIYPKKCPVTQQKMEIVPFEITSIKKMLA